MVFVFPLIFPLNLFPDTVPFLHKERETVEFAGFFYCHFPYFTPKS